MFRLLVGLSLLVCCPLGLVAQNGQPKNQPNKPEVTLKIGDPAPNLKVAEWVKGSEVRSFEPGKVYVVEFWATWCGPCIAAMPHLSEIQEEYRDKGVTIVSLTSPDSRGNTEKAVKEFVKGRGENIMRYNVGWCGDRSTNDAFMKAAGQGGIPCSFVIDQKGKIAYIGHPLILDEVLPKVIAGKWRGKADAEVASKSLDDFFTMLQNASREPEEGLKMFAEAEKQTPKLAALQGDFKMMLLMRAKRLDEAEAMFREIMTRSIEKKDGAKLVSISRTWSTDQLNPENRNIKLAVEAIEGAQKINGTKDLSTLLTSAQVYHAAGDKAKASEFATKAIEASPNDRVREQIKRMVEKYQQQ